MVNKLTYYERDYLISLIFEFAFYIDHNDGEGVAELFVEDGVYGYDGFELVGRNAIRNFYVERRSRGPRTSRHIFSNVRVSALAPGEAVGSTMLTLYAADSGSPHVATPLAVMDYADHFSRVDGNWLFRRRWVTPVFGHVPNLVAAQTKVS